MCKDNFFFFFINCQWIYFIFLIDQYKIECVEEMDVDEDIGTVEKIINHKGASYKDKKKEIKLEEEKKKKL